MAQACDVHHLKAPPAFHFHTSKHTTFSHLVYVPPTSFLTMQRFDVKRVRAAIWKWLCRCPDAIGPFGDMSSDDEFFTPPTSPLPCAEDVDAARFSASSTLTPSGDAHRLLSPAQTRRLQRRHAAVVSQLTTPPPVVAPRPQPPLKAYQRPIMVYRPSWAP